MFLFTTKFNTVIDGSIAQMHKKVWGELCGYKYERNLELRRLKDWICGIFRFLASHDIYLAGIEFFGPILNGPLTSYKIKYRLENEFMSFYYKTPSESASLLTAHDFEVEFPHPMKITAQIPYKLVVCLEVH